MAKRAGVLLPPLGRVVNVEFAQLVVELQRVQRTALGPHTQLVSPALATALEAPGARQALGFDQLVGLGQGETRR